MAIPGSPAPVAFTKCRVYARYHDAPKGEITGCHQLRNEAIRKVRNKDHHISAGVVSFWGPVLFVFVEMSLSSGVTEMRRWILASSSAFN